MKGRWYWRKEQTRVGAKSKRERPTMDKDTWKEEKVANRESEDERTLSCTCVFLLIEAS